MMSLTNRLLLDVDFLSDYVRTSAEGDLPWHHCPDSQHARKLCVPMEQASFLVRRGSLCKWHLRVEALKKTSNSGWAVLEGTPGQAALSLTPSSIP